MGAESLPPAGLTLPAQALQSPSQDRDPAACQAAVGLELGLAGAPRPDAAVHPAGAEALEVLPHAAHAREVVLELRQLDLELALGAVRMLGEDVEDQLGAIDDTRLQLVLELSLLRRAQLVVDEQRLCAGGLVRLLELDELAFAHERPRIRPRSMLDRRSHGLHTGGPCELCDLVELAALVGAGSQHGHDEAPLRLDAGTGLGLARRHALIMTFCRELSIRRTASSSSSSETVMDSRTNPSPLAPYPGPGATTTFASSSTSDVNEAES